MTPREMRSAAVVFALLLPSLAAMFWSSQEAARAPHPGPLRTFTAQGQEHAAIVFDGALHLLDAQGERFARQPLAELALADEPNDMDWTVDAEGKLGAWFFDDDGPRIVRCAYEATPAPRLAGCRTVLTGTRLKIDASSRAVHIAADPARDRVFVADARGHAVRMLSLSGAPPVDGARGELFFPNRLRLVDGELVVADNDHRRLAWLDVDGERPTFALRRTVDLQAHPAVQGRRKAADFALLRHAEGQPAALWALAVRQGQKDGQILVYGPGLAPRGQADLGGHADPLVIDRLGDALLVGDFAGAAYYRVGADGRFLGTFGAGAFAREVAAARDRAHAARTWQQVGWAGLALTLLVGFALAWRFSERPGAQAARVLEAEVAALPAERPAQPLALAPADWFRRQLLAGKLATTVIVLGVIGVLAWMLPHELPPRLAGTTLWILGPLLSLAVVAVGWAAVRTHAQRILWIGPDRVEVRLGKRTLASSSFATLLATQRMLMVGRVVLAYRGARMLGAPGRWIYDEEAFKRYVLASLQAHQRLDDRAFARAQFARLPRWLAGLMVLPLLVYAVYAAWMLLR